MKNLYILLFLFIMGCSSFINKPVEVQIPISIPCKITSPEKPKFMLDNLESGKDIFTQVKYLLAERKQRQGYEIELEAAIQSCNK